MAHPVTFCNWPVILVALGALWLGGCSTPTSMTGSSATPFRVERLGVPNDCFVESVRFHDDYFDGQQPGGSRWARVLDWGVFEKDFAFGQGHAVTIFQWRGSLFLYDINQGVRRLAVPVAQRDDIRAVTPPVFALYPKFKPVFPKYMVDAWQEHQPGLVGGDGGDLTASYIAARKVAQSLSKVRRVRLIRFNYTANGRRQQTAAAVFTFERRLCAYIPERGTLVTSVPLPSVDDLGVLWRQLSGALGPGSQVELVTPPEIAVRKS